MSKNRIALPTLRAQLAYLKALEAELRKAERLEAALGTSVYTSRCPVCCGEAGRFVTIRQATAHTPGIVAHVKEDSIALHRADSTTIFLKLDELGRLAEALDAWAAGRGR